MGVSDSRGKMVKRPMLELELLGTKGNKISGLGLVDSGADTTMLHIQYATAPGLILDATKTKDVIGVGSGRVKVYTGPLRLKIKHLDKELEVPAWFVDSENVNILLGQEVFFEMFRIKFEKDHDTFEVTASF